MAYDKITLPAFGEKIILSSDGTLKVPDRPIIPFIEGDGTGPDITRAAMIAWDAAVAAAYGDRRKIAWMEVYAGDKAVARYGEGEVLPEETGLIVADQYGAAVLREAPLHPLPGARRKEVTLRFARAAASRLHAALDPEGARGIL